MIQSRFYKILFFFLAIFFASCENNLNTINLITAKDKTPLLVENNATVNYTDSGKVLFNLKAPRIENYGGNDPYMEFTKGISIDFYNDSGKINGHLDANYAIRHENSKLMEADNDVRVLNKKGERLNTEQLFWDANKHLIYTSKFVTIHTDKRTIYGTDLTSNEDFTHYKIQNVSGKDTILMDENGKKE
jgi:LPS export ABC transporter protein LptC